MYYSVKKIALKLVADGPVKVLATPRKVQLLFGGKFIVRTINAVYVWEHPYYPQVSFSRVYLDFQSSQRFPSVQTA